MAVMARLDKVWQSNTISFTSKFKLYQSPVIFILLCGLLTLKKRIQAFETTCQRKLLLISDLEHKTNDWVQSNISFHVGIQELLLATVMRQKLAWFEHVMHHNSLSKTILQGTFEG